MHKHSCIAVQPHRLYDPGPLYLYYTAHKEYYLSIRYAPSCTCRTNSILCTTCTLWGYDRRRCIHRSWEADGKTDDKTDGKTDGRIHLDVMLRTFSSQACLYSSVNLTKLPDRGRCDRHNCRFLPRPLAHVCIRSHRWKDTLLLEF